MKNPAWKYYINSLRCPWFLSFNEKQIVKVKNFITSGELLDLSLIGMFRSRLALIVKASATREVIVFLVDKRVTTSRLV